MFTLFCVLLILERKVHDDQICWAAHSGVADIYGLLGRDMTPDNLQIVSRLTVATPGLRPSEPGT